MPKEILVALIAAGTALAVVLFRDLLFKLLKESRERKLTSAEIFRRYADPLANAGSSLLWRLDEVLNHEGRGAFLLSTTPATAFTQYKRLSTIYRLAALLGWIRAFRRELSFLRTHDEKQQGIKEAVGALEAGLADGKHVESRRLDGLLDLWAGTFSGACPNRGVVETRVEQALKDFLHQSDVVAAGELPESEQLVLCKILAVVLGDCLREPPPADDIILETRARAIQCLSLREAWLFRDWQAGIGDLMIKKAPEGGRLFEVVGYGQFEEMASNGNEQHQRWVRRLVEITDDLDLSKAPRFDARVELLHNTLHATARLVRALAKEAPHQRALLGNTLDLAERLERQEVAPSDSSRTRGGDE